MAEVNILVTGNGFDIHHGMKTKYTDFLEFAKEYREGKVDYIEGVSEVMDEAVNDNNLINFFLLYKEQVKGWIDLESLIKEVVKFISLYIERLTKEKSVNYNGVHYNFALKADNALDKMIAYSFTNLFRVEKEIITLKEAYRSVAYTVNKDEIEKLLHKELDDLRNILSFYFKYYEINRREKEYQKEIVYNQIKNINIDQVITFNYTDIYERYGVPPINITHIHGKCNSINMSKGIKRKWEAEFNNIVLGYQDDNEKELDFVYFKKYLQCIIFQTELITDKCFEKGYRANSVESIKSEEFILDKNEIIVHFFGHSLDKTDAEKLLPILDKANKVKIYCMNDRDFEIKVIKLIDLLGKERAVKELHDKKIKFIEINYNLYDGEETPTEEINMMQHRKR